MISKDEKARLKAEGILAQSQEGYFSIRILSRAGNFTAEQLINLSKLSEKYGRGYLGVTTRLAVEIPWIKYEDIDLMKEDLKAVGLKHGGTGKKVRPLVACKGTVCQHGIYDTQELCGKLHDSYFGYDLPSKTKITLVGCPNNCAKANTNDVGIVGQVYVKFNEDKCKNCGLCTSSCRQKSVYMEDKKLVWNKEECVNCGKCAQACPFGAMEVDKKGLAVYLGGRMGRGYRFGDRLSNLYTEDNIEELVQDVFYTYKQLASPGERISKVLERIGIEEFEKHLFNIKLQNA
ncbi:MULTISPECIES: 4Fe-4S binding protein [unclassified Clostridioides]|uniref:4Fe-4S binding protein n=2 Tax=unclassified Clostridioides TaxID=2635829 RepID=UPI001D0CD113|nr:4Fe-4S binding protein [Clostridioides sp. ES-S-0001-02]MCC0654335.1 4Fe-4S binding protein [Clostridioides sp. ES-S-0001-03]MCC0657842.1 4Fe-4S binding protein [Clostridioides sp. ES-S-0123-01]MCC0695840.1 4Fe-4S binding protein [Clostridioides sp. ES-S-0048-02]MCC0708910.1 4Fe-4S binding protein [Clostridioides sp. ES-S-0190-01]UDN58367.1 4Fe-4S binding protein [Clostridioides sp. ES-S-0010-02]UDN62103.1 4Fe-4S binding protein [Clostridioides sp. ES-W-0016-02]